LNKEDLRLVRLASQSGLLPDLTRPIPPVPQALTAEAAGAIYGRVARFGFSSFQMVPGGAVLATAEGTSILTLTGTGWQLQENLEKTAFRLVLDKQTVALEQYLAGFPGVRMVGHTVEVAGLWDGVTPNPTDYIASRFLKDQASALVTDMRGLTYNGGSIRLSLFKESEDPLPPGIQFGVEAPRDTFDIRIEPFFGDKSKMWVQVNAIYPVPTDSVQVIERRTALARDILWDDLADRLSFGT